MGAGTGRRRMSTEAKRAPVQKRKEKPASSDGQENVAPTDDGNGPTTEKDPEMGTVIEKESAPANIAGTTPELRRDLLHSMLLQRRFEERCAEAYALGKSAVSVICTSDRKRSRQA